MRAGVGKQGLVDEIERRGGAFDVQQDGTNRLVVQCHLKNGLTRTENKTVPGTPADSCDLPRYPCNAVSSPRDLGTGESPESPAIRTQINPVPGAARNPDQVAGLYFDRGKRADLRPDVKESTSMNDEAHFVFVMPVFATELGQHGFQVRGRHYWSVCSVQPLHTHSP